MMKNIESDQKVVREGNPHIGSDFNDFLKEIGEHEEIMNLSSKKESEGWAKCKKDYEDDFDKCNKEIGLNEYLDRKLKQRREKANMDNDNKETIFPEINKKSVRQFYFKQEIASQLFKAWTQTMELLINNSFF